MSINRFLLMVLIISNVSCSVSAKPNVSCKGDEGSLACIRASSVIVNSEIKKVIVNIEKSTDNKQQFQTAQIKWQAYKNSYCRDFIAAEATYAQGDGATKIIESCLLSIDKERLVELKRLNRVYSVQ